MLLYHGTPKSKGNSIIKERKISKSAPALFDNMAFDFCNTTTGYIYLSDGFFTALHWGDIHATNMKEDGFYIFRVDIDEELLLPDLDEKKIDDITMVTSLTITPRLGVDYPEDDTYNSEEYLGDDTEYSKGLDEGSYESTTVIASY